MAEKYKQNIIDQDIQGENFFFNYKKDDLKNKIINLLSNYDVNSDKFKILKNKYKRNMTKNIGLNF